VIVVLNIFSFRIHRLGNAGHLWLYVEVGRHRTSMHQGGLWFFTSISKEFCLFFLFVLYQHTEMDITFFLAASTPKPTVRQWQFDL